MSDNILHKINTVELSSAQYGKDVNDRFNAIDDNFQRIVQTDFLTGRHGNDLSIWEVILDKNDDSPTNYYYDDEGVNVVTSKSLYDKIMSLFNDEQFVGVAEGKIYWYSDLNGCKISLIYETIDDKKVIKSSLPFTYIDSRFKSAPNMSAEESYKMYDNIIDRSSTIYYQDNDFVCIQNFPTLYFDKNIGGGCFCWKINQTQTGLVAQGPQGPRGIDGKLYICKLGVKTDTLNSGQFKEGHFRKIEQLLVLGESDNLYVWKNYNEQSIRIPNGATIIGFYEAEAEGTVDKIVNNVDPFPRAKYTFAKVFSFDGAGDKKDEAYAYCKNDIEVNISALNFDLVTSMKYINSINPNAGLFIPITEIDSENASLTDEIKAHLLWSSTPSNGLNILNMGRVKNANLNTTEEAQIEIEAINPEKVGKHIIQFNGDVQKIGARAFENQMDLTYIKIPEGVVSIEDLAFAGCENLTHIEIPASVKSIGKSAFYGCTSLEEIIFKGNSIEFFDPDEQDPNIPDGAYYGVFENCSSLTSINLPCTTIAKRMFANSGISNIVNINEIKKIDDYAFENCLNLSTISLSEGLESIGVGSFLNCSALSLYKEVDGSSKYDYLTLPSSLKSIGDSAFKKCPLRGVIFEKSENDLEIGRNAFEGCQMTELTIVPRIRRIGSNAFSGNDNLKLVKCEGVLEENGDDVVLNPEPAKAIFDGENWLAFGEILSLAKGFKIYTPSSEENNSIREVGRNEYINADGWKEYAKYFILYDFELGKELPEYRIKFEGTINGISTIGKDVNGNEVEDFVINNENGIISYGVELQTIVGFLNQTSLTGIEIPNGVTTIGEWAFWGCTNLTSVTIPDSVTTIRNQAFFNCTNLKSVIIPDSVITIEDKAFQSCFSLTNVTIGNRVTTIGDSVFSSCKKLARVTIPDSVTTIGNQAFYNCSNLPNVTIPDSVTSIGDKAFQGCSELYTINIPEAITYIGHDAFNVGRKLNSVEINCKPSISYSTDADTGRWNAFGEPSLYDSKKEFVFNTFLKVAEFDREPWNEYLNYAFEISGNEGLQDLPTIGTSANKMTLVLSKETLGLNTEDDGQLTEEGKIKFEKYKTIFESLVKDGLNNPSYMAFDIRSQSKKEDFEVNIKNGNFDFATRDIIFNGSQMTSGMSHIDTQKLRGVIETPGNSPWVSCMINRSYNSMGLNLLNENYINKITSSDIEISFENYKEHITITIKFSTIPTTYFGLFKRKSIFFTGNELYENGNYLSNSWLTPDFDFNENLKQKLQNSEKIDFSNFDINEGDVNTLINSIEQIYMPSKIEQIGKSSFTNFQGLKKIILPEQLRFITSSSMFIPSVNIDYIENTLSNYKCYDVRDTIKIGASSETLMKYLEYASFVDTVWSDISTAWGLAEGKYMSNVFTNCPLDEGVVMPSSLRYTVNGIFDWNNENEAPELNIHFISRSNDDSEVSLIKQNTLLIHTTSTAQYDKYINLCTFSQVRDCLTPRRYPPLTGNGLINRPSKTNVNLDKIICPIISGEWTKTSIDSETGAETTTLYCPVNITYNSWSKSNMIGKSLSLENTPNWVSWVFGKINLQDNNIISPMDEPLDNADIRINVNIDSASWDSTLTKLGLRNFIDENGDYTEYGEYLLTNIFGYNYGKYVNQSPTTFILKPKLKGFSQNSQSPLSRRDVDINVDNILPNEIWYDTIEDKQIDEKYLKDISFGKDNTPESNDIVINDHFLYKNANQLKIYYNEVVPALEKMEDGKTLESKLGSSDAPWTEIWAQKYHGNIELAEKSNCDGLGNNIYETYLPKSNGILEGPLMSLSIYPVSSEKHHLGDSNHKWSSIYVNNIYGETFDGIAAKAEKDSDGNKIVDTYLKKTGRIAWSQITDKPTEFTPADHKHNFSEIDGELQIEQIPTGTSQDTVALGNHNHDGIYSPVRHTHTGVYSPVDHTHNGVYSPIDHTHTGYQATLNSGINIKTINGESILGRGNIAISGDSESSVKDVKIGSTGNSIVENGTAYIPFASSNSAGVVAISSAIDSNSEVYAATSSAVKKVYDLVSDKQDILVSGTNIKTINGKPLIGEGNIEIIPNINNEYSITDFCNIIVRYLDGNVEVPSEEYLQWPIKGDVIRGVYHPSESNGDLSMVVGFELKDLIIEGIGNLDIVSFTIDGTNLEYRGLTCRYGEINTFKWEVKLEGNRNFKTTISGYVTLTYTY